MLFLFVLPTMLSGQSNEIILTNCGVPMRFEKRNAHKVWDIPIRFANQCLEEDTLIIDFVTLNVPDKFYVTDGLTGDTIIDTKWIWCNFEVIPHGTPCYDGYMEIYPDTVIFKDQIPYDHYLYNDQYWGKYNKKGYGRLVIPYATDYVILHVYPDIWDETIIGVYAHCVEEPYNQCIKVQDTVMYQCFEDQQMPLRYFKIGKCCDTLFRIHWENHVFEMTWNDTFACYGDTIVIEPPVWAMQMSLDYEIFGDDTIVVLKDEKLHMRIYDDTCSGIADKKVYAIIPPMNIEDVLFVKKGTGYVFDLCNTSWKFLDGECWKMYIINDDRVVMETITNDTCTYVLKYEFRVYDEVPYYAPNVFRPGSINNGKFEIFFMPDYDDKVKEFFIFDRWGNMLLESNEPVWDGTFRGKAMDNGVYVWQMVMESGKIYVGDVIIAK
ncbi:MAG: hypothetical protein D6717_04460 [Gammaproteobacteria bacterium]|nr:MAG: hypothetical protein D6717_04460 [Gammaproteobacteria bacterium]